MSTERISRTVFIGGITSKVNYKDVEGEFKRFGSIDDIKMKGDYAFIEFKYEDDADRAIKEMGNGKICGHQITVQKSYGGRNKRTKAPEGKDTCFNCGNKGHW